MKRYVDLENYSYAYLPLILVIGIIILFGGICIFCVYSETGSYGDGIKNDKIVTINKLSIQYGDLIIETDDGNRYRVSSQLRHVFNVGGTYRIVYEKDLWGDNISGFVIEILKTN